MLIRYPRTVMVNNENYYKEYTATYQIVSAKALVQGDFPAYVLSKHKANPSQETKVLKKSSKLCHFVKIKLYGMQTLNVSTLFMQVSDAFSKSSGTSWFPRACTIWVLTKSWYKEAKCPKMAQFKRLSFCQNVFFMASNFFMQIFNVSTLFMQSIRWLQ